jgi:hypothetical protein
MKGILHKTDEGWIVRWTKEDHRDPLPELSLHPNDAAGLFIQDTDSKNEGKEVEFDWCVIVDHDTGKGKQYAKLIQNDFQTKPGFVEKRMALMLEHLANEEFKNVGDEGLFPNHTDKDIWIAGFKAGYLKK